MTKQLFAGDDDDNDRCLMNECMSWVVVTMIDDGHDESNTSWMLNNDLR